MRSRVSRKGRLAGWFRMALEEAMVGAGLHVAVGAGTVREGEAEV